MKYMQALRKGLFVVLLLANITSKAFCIELSPAQQQQPVKPIAIPTNLFTVQIKCPAHVTFILSVNAVSGWGKNEYGTGGDIERAQITYQPIYGKDSLQCMIGPFPMTSRLIEKGTCVVGSDLKSFNCKPILLK